MSAPPSRFALSRILVALDASPPSLAALNAAAALAARMDAELAGLFVEDIALLRLAESPFAREVLYYSSKEVPLTPASMEATLRAQSERARLALASAAERARVRWTFRTVRGEVTATVLDAAAEADLLALGTHSWSLSRRVRTGSTALEAASGSIPVLLIAEHGALPDGLIAVYYDGTPGTDRGLLAAAHLAQTGADNIVVLIAAKDPEHAATLHEEASRWVKQANVRVRYRQIDAEDEAGLLRVIKAEKPGTLVLGGRDATRKFQRLESGLRDMDLVFLLLDGSNPEAK